jgi:chondroitin AC lyase
VLTVWIEHGADPRGASYAYIVRPTDSEAAPRINILANTTNLQAAATDDLAALAFHAPGAVKTRTFGEVSVAQPGLVLLRRTGLREAELSVADPTTKLERLEVRVGGKKFDFELPRGDRAGATVTRKIGL